MHRGGQICAKNTAAQRFHCAAVFHKSGSQKIKLFSGLGCLDLLDELRHNLEQIADDAVICHTEDGCRLVLVDGDDALGILHTSGVLDGTGNTQSNVDLGVDGLAG